MKKQETVGSGFNYYNTLHPFLEEKKSSAITLERSPSREIAIPTITASRYIFFTNTDNDCIIVQFKQLDINSRLYRFNINRREILQTNAEEHDLLISSTYMAVQHPTEAIAQVVVDFMISQPKVKLIIEKDLDIFYEMLNRLWKEFNTLFRIKGLLNGHWSNCEQKCAYDAYMLVK